MEFMWQSLIFAVLLLFFFVPISCHVARRSLWRTLRESEERYRSTVENAVEGIIQTSRDGGFLRVNGAYARMLGYESSEELICKVRDIDREVYVDPEVRRDFLMRLARDKKAKCEYQTWKKDGSTIWVLASSRVVQDSAGRFLYYESIVEDVTERRQNEARLKDLAESLARSNADLNRFAQTVAHDLTEPLRTLSTYSALLTRIYRNQVGPEADTYADFVDSATKRMKALIDDILAFAQVEWSSSSLEPLDMNQLVKEVVHGLETTIQEKQVTVDIARLPTIQGDRFKLQRLFQNLVANSIKFRSPGSAHVLIDCNQEGTRHTFSVRDNGIGFDPKYSEAVFKLFARVANRKDHPGSGMGLATCKSIVEFHGGRIWADSSVGKGTTVFFTLPANAPEAASARRPNVFALEPRRKSIHS